MGSCVSKRKQVAHLPNERAIDISHFEVLDQVGKGGFAEVYAAKKVSTAQFVALKVIPKRRVLIPKSRRRSTVSEPGEGDSISARGSTRSMAPSEPEYRISSSVFIERQILEAIHDRSCFLPELIHAFQNTDYLYMVLPFYQGGDLQHLINRLGPLPEASIRFYAAEIILALESLHSQGIVYRDLKPRNVLLRSTGHLVLTDFGLCRFLNKNPSDTIKGRAGTKGYLAPEAINGEEYRFSVDFFSLGATLYKLATKKLPFGKTENFGSRQVKWSTVPRGLAELLQALMALDPNQRLGCGADGWLEVKRHRFFHGMDWEESSKQAYKPPFLPKTDSITSNCPDTFKPSRFDRLAAASGDTSELTADQQKLFEGFEYATTVKRGSC